jgi:hypothetical protein
VYPTCPASQRTINRQTTQAQLQGHGPGEGYRIDPGVVSLVAELRGHERRAVGELEQGNTSHEERKVVDASPAAITLATICTREQLAEMGRYLSRWRKRAARQGLQGMALTRTDPVVGR